MRILLRCNLNTGIPHTLTDLDEWNHDFHEFKMMSHQRMCEVFDADYYVS